MNRYLILFLSAAAVLTGLNACHDSNGKDTEEPAAASANAANAVVDVIRLTPRQLESANVNLVQFEDRTLQPIIYANGVITLLPDSKAEVSSHIDGKIEQIFVREGQSVKKGQPLARISSFQLLELQNDYAAAHSEVEYLEVEYKRQDELRKSNIGVLADYQSVDAKLKAALARERALKNKLDIIGVPTASLIRTKDVRMTSSLVVRSPIDGFIFKFHENIGSTVQPETLLAEVINPNRTQADIYVYEKDADYVREGQPVELRFVNHSSAPVRGKVAYISRSLDAENRAITLHVTYERPKTSNLMLADMNVQARLIGVGTRTSQNTLPRTAILDDGEAKFIFLTSRWENDTIPLKKQKVEIVSQGESFVEVRPVGKVPAAVKVANNNVLALEAERKKLE
ncbi:efflux RND transporter periplasmic adaptor subunit [Tellurirhabdus rosea]|uniref:efflux RND transporter periplasmic adaptor subunit n=1 Tax=Tellurirhabdus rosea TaxID=2674997 RepID=UPI00225B07B2|nr:efflux RND transporter periplasmic adaptor subunit [Tellurirhabdus rosea]